MVQRIEVPGMGVVEFPDGMTDNQIAAAIKANMPAEKPARGIAGAIGDLAAGAVRGAGGIGATILAPYDMARDAMAGKGLSLESNRQRREDMTGGLASLGADTDSFAFGAGKLGGEIAGTMGTGGLLARGASLLPGASRAAPALEALSSAGFKAGGLTGVRGLGVRAAGGAVAGGASAGLVNPEDAALGAAIGGVLPGGIQAAGYLGRAAAAPFKSQNKKAAETLMKGLDAKSPEYIAQQLAAAKELIAGSKPTVAQVLRSPQASTLERIVSETPGGALLKERYLDQNAARFGALNRVAPVDPRGFASAADDFGMSALTSIRGGDQSARAATRAAYEAVPQDDAALYLPDLASVRDELFPRGAFGSRAAADQAVNVAQEIGSRPMYAQAAGKETQTLAQAVRKAGGLSLTNNGGLRGETIGIRGEFKNIIRKDGKSLDQMAELMASRGFIPDESADTLIEALKNEARGGRSFSAENGAASAWASARDSAMGDQGEAAKVTLREFDALRKSIGNAARAAKQDPERATEALALSRMRDSMDDRINEVLRGDGAIDEVLPQAWADQLSAAQRLKREQVQKFRTGPQAEAFKTGSDGLPKVHGGEFSRLVWGNRPGVAQDIKQFKQVMDDKPELLKQFRTMVTTDAARTATNAGNLTGQFVRWVDNMLPALKESFDANEVRLLQRLAADIKRAEVAVAAGGARGSPTYQNAANAMSLGLLDSPITNVLANRIPFVGSFTGPFLETLRASGKNAKAEQLAGLLADPNAAADALMSIRARNPRLLDAAQRGLLLSAPVVASQ